LIRATLGAPGSFLAACVGRARCPARIAIEDGRIARAKPSNVRIDRLGGGRTSAASPVRHDDRTLRHCFGARNRTLPLREQHQTSHPVEIDLARVDSQ
jgi:hypothetical protein